MRNSKKKFSFNKRNKIEGRIRLFTFNVIKDLIFLKRFIPIKDITIATWNFFVDCVVCLFSRSLVPNNVLVLSKNREQTNI